MDRIKIVKRIGLPETNSSSSHAVAINPKGRIIGRDDPEFNLKIVDNILYVPKRMEDFGWDWDKSNNVQTKLQYLCGIFCNDVDSVQGQKKMFKFKKFLKDTLGVDDVVFEWIRDYSEKLKSDPEAYYDGISIDHNSTDIFDEIIETTETMKYFLLSPDSWWYGGNDNSTPPDNFYEETEFDDTNTTGFLSFDAGGDIGRIDFEIDNFPMESNFLRRLGGYNSILEHFRYDVKQKKVIVYSPPEMDYLFRKETESLNNHLLAFYYNEVYYNSKGEPCIVCISPAIKNLIRPWEMTSKYKKLSELISHENVVEGVDYVAFPLILTSDEYNIK